MPARSAVRLVVETRLGTGISRAEIARRLSRIMSALKLDDAELSVVLTGDDQIQELNRLYRKKDRSTDVLAFAMNEGHVIPGSPSGTEARLLGDVIVSIPTARAQAKQASRSPLEEVTMLLAHGVLHLLGWDHDTKAKERSMFAETDRLCDEARSRRKSATTRAQHRQPRQRKLS